MCVLSFRSLMLHVISMINANVCYFQKYENMTVLAGFQKKKFFGIMMPPCIHATHSPE